MVFFHTDNEPSRSDNSDATKKCVCDVLQCCDEDGSDLNDNVVPLRELLHEMQE